MLKKFLISAVFGAAAIGAIPAMAAAQPNWTKDEKATIETYTKFNACMQEGMEASANNAAPAIKAIIEARNKAAADATTKAAKDAGMTEEQIKIVSDAMLNADADALATVIMSAEQEAQIGTCAQTLGVADKDGSGVTEEFKAKVRALKEKNDQFINEQLEKAPSRTPQP